MWEDDDASTEEAELLEILQSHFHLTANRIPCGFCQPQILERGSP